MQGRRYRLRWRFDYANGSTKFGIWDNPGTTDHDKAWNKTKGIVRASIEAKEIATSKIGTIIECKGSAFRNFQWVAAARVPKAIGLKGSITPPTQLVGIKLLTENDEYCVLGTGELKKRPLTDAEKSIQFAAYGK